MATSRELKYLYSSFRITEYLKSKPFGSLFNCQRFITPIKSVKSHILVTDFNVMAGKSLSGRIYPYVHFFPPVLVQPFMSLPPHTPIRLHPQAICGYIERVILPSLPPVCVYPRTISYFRLLPYHGINTHTEGTPFRSRASLI